MTNIMFACTESVLPRLAEGLLTIAAGSDIHHPVNVTFNMLVDIAAQFQVRAAGLFICGGVLRAGSASAVNKRTSHSGGGAKQAAEAASQSPLAWLRGRRTLGCDVGLAEGGDFRMARGGLPVGVRRDRHPRASSLSRRAPISAVELSLDLAVGRLGLGLLVLHSLAQIIQSTVPSCMALCRGCSKLHVPARSTNEQTLLVEAWGVRVQVIHLLNRLNGHTLGLQLDLPCSLRIDITPVQRPSVRVNPEETSVTFFRHVFATGLAGVLPKILSNHCLGNGLNHPWISCACWHTWSSKRGSASHVETLVKLRAKRRQRGSTADWRRCAASAFATAADAWSCDIRLGRQA